MRAPSARMQRCDKADPSAGRGVRDKAAKPVHFHPPLTLEIAKKFPSQNYANRLREKELFQRGARGMKQNGDIDLPLPPSLLLPATAVRKTATR